tara:strand:- start:87 stop:929 length:843 start_codon:yes stop_codon:yes gene_type:complete
MISKGNIIYRAVNYFIRKERERKRTKKWSSSNEAFIENNYKKLLSMRNSHKNQECYVIGNGPSLNKIDLNLLKNKITIACNSFYLKHNELDFLPSYYTVEDPLPAVDNKLEINKIKGVKKIIPYDLRNVITPSDDVTYINFLRSYMRPSNKKFPIFSKEVENKIYWGGTVVYMNIQFAAFLGCNPIYLIGVDLNYKIPKNIKRDGHILTSKEDDPNHFHPEYFGKGKKWHLPKVDLMQRSFSRAYLDLKDINVKLINATKGGNLELVPRVDYCKINKKND